MSVPPPFSSQVAPMFAVPVFQAQHPDPAALNAELKALFLLREHDRTTYGNPNPSLKQQDGVFESDFTLFSWPEAACRRCARSAGPNWARRCGS